jgi:hypothetical protein
MCIHGLSIVTVYTCIWLLVTSWSVDITNSFNASLSKTIRTGIYGINRMDHLSMEELEYLEDINELYYQRQKNQESKVKVNPHFRQLIPNFPCIFGEVPVGNNGEKSISDGHKFACGLSFITQPMIVYSFGSHKDQLFELSLLKLRPDASIFLFEILKTALPDEQERDPRVIYHDIGLGYPTAGSVATVPTSGASASINPNLKSRQSNSPAANLKEQALEKRPKIYSIRQADGVTYHKITSLTEVMSFYSHTYIDVLKLDIEGEEFHWLRQESEWIIPRVGQLLVEIHKVHKNETVFGFVTAIENLGMRLFHQEINYHSSALCSELSFIQEHWLEWNYRYKHL